MGNQKLGLLKLQCCQQEPDRLLGRSLSSTAMMRAHGKWSPAIYTSSTLIRSSSTSKRAKEGQLSKRSTPTRKLGSQSYCLHPMILVLAKEKKTNSKAERAKMFY